MADPITQLQAVLKDKGYSLTGPRVTVFEALQNREQQTMRDLVGNCHKRVDRASVYRTIQLFEQLGVVQRLQIGWKYRLELSDLFSRHHHHLACVHCGRTSVLPEDAALERRMHALASARGFTPLDHQLEIRGLCRACQNSSTS